MGFGMVFQGAALFDSFTVEENVGLALREHTELSDEEIQPHCGREAPHGGPGRIGDKNPSELSGGMKKRVGLARAIAMDPSVFSTTNRPPDSIPINADVINNLIVKLSTELHITSIVVTHDLQSAYKVAHRIVMLHNGKVLFEGTPEKPNHHQRDRAPVHRRPRGGPHRGRERRMTSRGLEIRVGAVVILGALIAVIGTMWFQKFQLAEKRYTFFVRFNEVGGLLNGDPIQINGVERGNVDRSTCFPAASWSRWRCAKT